MKTPLGVWVLAVVCVLLHCHLSLVASRGIKHRIKWSRKAAPSPPQVTEARVAMTRPGAFIREGRKLNIDFGAEGNRYYEANYWQFPDGIQYDGCSEANVTKEILVSGCINATQAANKAELSREKQGDKMYQQILWRLVKELCSVKHCDFWLEKGAGFRETVNQPVILCLLVFIWVLMK
ncbi:prion-like protein doppel [Octodon degus]|uniref:Prion-like protein doppel n=1 Tax=Octodon degus TaxID=10160 RepID=A0A6P3F8K1_OCTDE|nr:prion-like protein doppel [Octodon degus]